MLNDALELAGIGWGIFPCRPGLKTPATKNGFKDASHNATDVREWWTRNPHANIGVACGPASGFWALDMDVSNGALGAETLAALEAEHGDLPLTPHQRTGRGGRHYLFKWTEGVRNRGKFAPGLDVRGEGGYILVAPSRLTSGGPYEWIIDPEIELAAAPAWLMDMIVGHAAPREPSRVKPVQRPDGKGRASAWGEGALRSVCDQIAACPPGNQSDALIRAATRLGSISAGGSIQSDYARDSLVAAGLSMSNGDPRDPWTRAVVEDVVRRGMEYGSRDPTPAPEPRPSPSRPQLIVSNAEWVDPDTGEITPEPVPLTVHHGRDWMEAHRWIWKEDGVLKPAALWNLKTMTENHPALLSMFYYDEFKDQIIVTKGLPGDDRTNYPRELCDQDETALAAWLNYQGLSPAINTVAQVVREVAFRNKKNPMLDWLEALEWDGVDRVDRWLTKYAGVQETEYSRTVGRKFLISAVARAKVPGCKCDTMLILEGPQGLRKSTLARTLCGMEYFSDQIGDITSKESSQLIQGRWIIEVPEMDKFSRAESNAVKDFLARQEDRYRPPYGRNVVTRDRRCVFLGTINPIVGAGYIKDPTGARRFWPVACTRVDMNAMRLDREQLWAEAYYRWGMGETWWIDEDELHIVQGEQEERIEEDVWEPLVVRWIQDAPNEFTATQILSDALGVERSRQEQRLKNRVSAILTKLGYKRGKSYIDGKQQRTYRRTD
jgi:predicted P-loop ATPase